MTMRKLILGSLVAAAVGSVALPAAARTNVDLFVNFAPPPVRYEYVPAPRVGFAWVPGHWAWRGHRHVWVAGHWVRHRPGHYYRPARWVDYGGRWQYRPVAWHPGDRDGDGIPNRYDRDRDGDGVPNRYDRLPDNPRYR